MALKIGSSTKVITPEIGCSLMGQLYNRISTRVRDDLETNVLYVSDGVSQVLLLSCDLALLEREYCRQVQQEIEQATGVSASAVIIGCTHTHAGPYTTALLPDVPEDKAYLARLKNWLVEVAQEAVQSAVPASLGWAKGQAHIGYNRRLCWSDGSHTMYGDSRRLEFTGLEGPDDSQQTVLAAYDQAGKCLAIVHNNSCHATAVESADFISADFPGAARHYIRQASGWRVPVLYLQGASGDTSPLNMLAPESRVSGEQRCQEIGLLLAGETLHLMKGMPRTSEIPVKVAAEELKVKIRQPSAEELEKASQTVASGQEKAGRWNYVLAWSVLALQEKIQKSPVEILPIHAVRLGDFALVSNPCELYCQFGLDIKRRSPAEATAVVQLANGFSGYCPTIYGVMGGGYSGMTILWTRLEPFAGYSIVETSVRLLHQLWKQS